MARRPSSRPVRARSAAPVQMLATCGAERARRVMLAMNAVLPTSRRVPMPPGTIRMSMWRRVQRMVNGNRRTGAASDHASALAQDDDPDLTIKIAEHIQRTEHIQ